MKVLAVLSIVLGLIALAAGIHAAADTHPNYMAAVGAWEKSMEGPGDRLGGDFERASVDRDLSSYGELLKTELIFGMWGAGGLAILFGLIAGLKKRRVAFIGLALGLAAVVVSFLTQPDHW